MAYRKLPYSSTNTTHNPQDHSEVFHGRKARSQQNTNGRHYKSNTSRKCACESTVGFTSCPKHDVDDCCTCQVQSTCGRAEKAVADRSRAPRTQLNHKEYKNRVLSELAPKPVVSNTGSQTSRYTHNGIKTSRPSACRNTNGVI